MRITLGFRSYKQLHFSSFPVLPFCTKDEFMTALSELNDNAHGRVDEELESLKRGLSEDQKRAQTK